MEAVDRLGEDPGGGGLPHSPRAAEEVGVPEPAGADGVAKRGGDVGLADDIAEDLGPPFAGRGQVGRVDAMFLLGHGVSQYKGYGPEFQAVAATA